MRPPLPTPSFRNGHKTTEKKLMVSTGIGIPTKRKRNPDHISVSREVKRICGNIERDLLCVSGGGDHKYLQKRYAEIDEKFKAKEKRFELNLTRESAILDSERDIQIKAITYDTETQLEMMRNSVAKKFETRKRHHYQFRDQKSILSTPVGFEASEKFIMRKKLNDIIGDVADSELRKKLKISFDDVESQLSAIYSNIQGAPASFSKLTTGRQCFHFHPPVKTRGAYFHFCGEDFKLFDKVIFKRHSVPGEGDLTSIQPSFCLVRNADRLVKISYEDLQQREITLEKSPTYSIPPALKPQPRGNDFFPPSRRQRLR